MEKQHTVVIRIKFVCGKGGGGSEEQFQQRDDDHVNPIFKS